MSEDSEDEPIRVLHAEDDEDVADVACTYLRREDSRIRVESVADAREGLDRLADDGIDCVVSDYDMPGMNGIEFLEAVRQRYTDLPFILHTGKGSEEVASDAIAAGVTDYLQKEMGTSQCAVLANRIANAVEKNRTRRRVAELDRTRALVSEIHQAMVRAESADEVRNRVCEILSASDLYLSAWVGETDPETDRTEPQASAGDGHGCLGEATVTADGPAGTAVRERRVAVTRDVSEDRGFRSVAAVPLEYQDRLHGAVVVYTDRPNAFDENERDLLSELSGDIAHAIRSFEVRADLREERDFIEQSLGTLKDAFYVINTDGTLRRWNEHLADVTGYSDDDIAEMHATEFFPEDERERIADAMEETFTTGEAVVESEFLTADGERLPYEFTGSRLTDTDGDLTGLIGIGRDLTDRKERERKRKRVVERVTDAIVEVDDDWRFTLVNEQAEELYGTSEERLLGRSFWEVFEEAKGTRFEEEYRGAMEAREPKSFEEYFSGLDAWFDIDVYPSHGGGLEFYFRNVTERIRRINELERQNERLDEFAGIVSHELRNPLTVAAGQLELLKEENGSDERLEMITEAHDRIKTLIRDLLALAREGKGVEESDKEAVEVGGVAEDCWGNVDTADATLVVDCDHETRADRSRLAQLLENLMRNSVEHCGDGVTVTVGDLDDGNGFYVSDDGPGIPEGETDRVFESGYSTADGGTGFGLSIAREIAEAHGWGISAGESDEGGARLEITGIDPVHGLRS